MTRPDNQPKNSLTTPTPSQQISEADPKNKQLALTDLPDDILLSILPHLLSKNGWLSKSTPDFLNSRQVNKKLYRITQQLARKLDLRSLSEGEDLQNILFTFNNITAIKFPRWITSIPNDLPQSLEEVDLDLLEGTTLPETERQKLFQLPNLKKLTIRGDKHLTFIPDKLSESLEEVYLSACTALPNSELQKLFQLPNLKKLTIRGYKHLTFIPDKLSKSLEEVDLSGCTALSNNELQKIFQLPNLKKLVLQNSQLSSIPDNLPTSLEEVDLSSCTALPEQEMHKLFQLPNLKTIRIIQCPQFSKLPEGPIPRCEILGNGSLEGLRIMKLGIQELKQQRNKPKTSPDHSTGLSLQNPRQTLGVSIP